MSEAFTQVDNDEEVFPQMDGYLMACCDCGMVHEVKLTAVKVKNVFPDGTFGYQDLPRDKFRVKMIVNRVEKS
jgi:hypothetical protein